MVRNPQEKSPTPQVRDQRYCDLCRQPIAPARLEALPWTRMCVKCAEKNPPPPVDPATLDISQASPINKNGFAPSD
ncbi:MAG TPA: TraR/DksA C4-type zinc finger protein [Phycisphaerae bacterium]|nr:TraR/DksA C4-type zinc finger protein [Phycisphaerae bacterium]